MSDPKDDLERLLKRQKEEASEEEEVNWEEVLSEWITDVGAIMTQIREWLSDLAEQGLLSISLQEIERSEERLGTYVVPSLRIKFPRDDLVEVSPVARVVFGSQGRIDVTYGGAYFMLFLTKDRAWVLVERLSPISTIPLTDEVFLTALRDLVDGE